MHVSMGVKVLMSTPISDLVRGRVTGAASYKVLLGQVGLPSDLERYARRVVGKTRLRRGERIQAAEIVAVTLLEQAAERDPAAVLADQPKARVWASELTRSIAAERGIAGRLWAFLKLKILATLAVLFLIYGVQFYRFRFQEPVVSRNYAVEFNTTIASVPDSERAWDVLRQLGPLGPDVENPLEKRWPDTRPGDADWPAFAAFVHTRERQMTAIREAAHRPVLGFWAGVPPLEEESPQCFKRQEMPAASENQIRFAWLLPFLGKARGIARLAKADMRVAAVEGDGERVTEDAMAVLRLSELVRRPTMTISDLVSCAMVSFDADAVIEVLHDHPGLLNDAQLARIAGEYSKVDCASRFPAMIGSDMETIEDVVQRSWTDDGKGDGHFCLSGLKVFKALADQPVEVSDVLAGAVAIDWMASKKQVLARLHEVVGLHLQYSRQPLWERGSNPGADQAGVYERGSEGARYSHVCLFLGDALTKAADAVSLCDSERDKALIAIALERFRLAHQGAYPGQLSELVPEYLRAVPLDPFDGRPLRYNVGVEGPVVYSVGNNREDDGGIRVGKLDEARLFALDGVRGKVVEGDWVLWPPAPVETNP